MHEAKYSKFALKCISRLPTYFLYTTVCKIITNLLIFEHSVLNCLYITLSMLESQQLNRYLRQRNISDKKETTFYQITTVRAKKCSETFFQSLHKKKQPSRKLNRTENSVTRKDILYWLTFLCFSEINIR